VTRDAKPVADVWHVYMIRAADGSLYTGITKDVERRLAEHGTPRSKGAKYLRGRGPVALAFRARVGNRATALRLEHRIKRLSKPRKERIVADRPDLARLFDMLTIEPPKLE